MDKNNGILKIRGEEFKVENLTYEKDEKARPLIVEETSIKPSTETNYYTSKSNKNWIYMGLGIFLLLVIISLFWFNINVSHEKLKGNITVNTNIAPAEVNVNTSVTPINYNNYTIINNNNLSITPIIINSINITELMHQLKPYLINYSVNNSNSS
jgi:hypothetical protein